MRAQRTGRVGAEAAELREHIHHPEKIDWHALERMEREGMSDDLAEEELLESEQAWEVAFDRGVRMAQEEYFLEDFDEEDY